MLHNDHKLLHSCIVYQRATYPWMATRSFEYYKRCCGNERGKRCEIVTASFCGQSDCFATQFQKTFFSKCYNTQIQVRFCTECKESVEDMGCFTPCKKPSYDLCDHCKVKMKFDPDVATEMFCPKCGMMKENIYFTIPYENKKETTKKYYLHKKQMLSSRAMVLRVISCCMNRLKLFSML